MFPLPSIFVHSKSPPYYLFFCSVLRWLFASIWLIFVEFRIHIIARLRDKKSSRFQMLKQKLQTCWYKIKENITEFTFVVSFSFNGKREMCLAQYTYLSICSLREIIFSPLLLLSVLKISEKTNPDRVWIMLLSVSRIKMILRF